MFPGMGIIRLREDQPLDLSLSLSCGQAFRWEEREGWWEGVVGESLWRVRQEGHRVVYSGTKGPAIGHYLSLDEDLPGILASVDLDPVMHRSIETCRGLRILRQDPWEILISFICATNTNIPRIRRMIASLARSFGAKVPGADEPFYRFPTPEALPGSCGGHLDACRLGYRDRYVAGTASLVADDPGLLERIAGLPLNEARALLLQFPGVGPKAADCILLFGFHRLESFPVDVWIRRIMHDHYVPPPPGMKSPSVMEDRRIRESGREHFGEYAGYAQEYLFCARELLEGEKIRSPGPRTSGTPPARL